MAGCDGLLTFVDEAFADASQTLHIFNNQRGGIKKLSLAGNGHVLAVDGYGSVQLFKPDKEDDEINVQKDENVSDGGFVNCLEQRPQIEIDEQPSEQKSWACCQAEEQIAKQRKTFENEIEEIGKSLGTIRQQVEQLLDSNDKLPTEESLDRRDFELNSDEKMRRIRAGTDREIDLQLELKAWQMARYRSGQRLRRQVWEDLEVRGQAIQVHIKVFPSSVTDR